MQSELKHKPFCFAGQAAPCTGYFPNDVLPCICGLEGDVITALTNVIFAFYAPQAAAETAEKDSGRTSSRRPAARSPRTPARKMKSRPLRRPGRNK
jgi:hypothetical protein